MTSLPDQPPRSDHPNCTRCGTVRPGFESGSTALPWGVRICVRCDMGATNAGPPVLLEYLRKGHQ
jgi:hypothetical protein